MTLTGIALYKSMRESFVLLAALDYEITEAILMHALDLQVVFLSLSPL